MHELTNLELKFIIKELQPLIGGRLDNIYGLEGERFRLKMRKAPTQFDLILDLNRKLIYLTKRIEKAPAPEDFVMSLRKRLKNAKAESIVQHAFDRVAVFQFSAKDGKFILIAELFSNGNLVLCNSEYKILNCLRREEWKDRRIWPGQTYAFPSAKIIKPSELSESKLASMMCEKHIISTLARRLPIGTIYLEEALARVDIGADEKGRTVDGKRLRKLAQEIKSMIANLSPRLYQPENAQPEFALTELSNHSLLKAEKFKTLSEAIDKAAASAPVEVKQDEGLQQQREKLKRALQEQRETLARYEAGAKEAKERGDAIYANYQKVANALEEGKKVRKRKVELEL
ncbi:hypothetical protein DRN67_03355 [Candidatus Micrarchaeota archaeon]|nr:MAG: hypothetical protein DRN67_03355 [Candidatus Micrarchaeota archaeon]